MRRFADLLRLSLIGLLAAVLLPTAVASAAIRTFPAPATVTGITAGPDGALWFTELFANKIGRITTAGSLSLFSLPPDLSVPALITPGGITAGSDGALWFAGGFKIGRITTAGAVSEFACPHDCAGMGITAGPDGALWFSSTDIGRMTTDGSVSEFAVVDNNHVEGDVGGITAGPDGAVWFTRGLSNEIGRMTTSGSLSFFSLPPASKPPPGVNGEFGVQGIAAGRDGALWFTDPTANAIGRMTTAGSVTEFPISTPASHPFAITAGPDGALWFTEPRGGKIGRISTAGSISEFKVPAPGEPEDITAGPDGALWFTGFGGYIGRIDPDTSPLGPARRFLGLSFVSKSLRVGKGGRVHPALYCPAAVGYCVGRDTLKTAARVSVAAKNRRHQRRILTLGSARFSIPAGQIGKVTIKLSRGARKLLAKKKRLRGREIVAAHDSRGTRKTTRATVTLKARKK